MEERVISHVDMDCFYVMVETALRPEFRGKPCAVVQYNSRGDLSTVQIESSKRFDNNGINHGSIIAVSYEARERGVKRNMSGNEAKKLSPEIQLIRVPTAHGKADLTIYRKAGAKVIEILSNFGQVERASVDEAYLDISQKANELLEKVSSNLNKNAWNEMISKIIKTHVAGIGDENSTKLSRSEITRGHSCVSSNSDFVLEWWQRPYYEWSKKEMLLACGACLINEAREEVKSNLNYSCSAGIAHNKPMAKLASSLHKPDQQTVVPEKNVPKLLETLPIERIKGLGGNLGSQVKSELNVSSAGELSKYSLNELNKRFGGKVGLMLFEMARGIDSQPVEQRELPKSVSCGKTFRGDFQLTKKEEVKKWLIELASELVERLDNQLYENKRSTKRGTVLFTALEANNENKQISRAFKLKDNAEEISEQALKQVLNWTKSRGKWGITSLYLKADNFEHIEHSTSIEKFFAVESGENLSNQSVNKQSTKKREMTLFHSTKVNEKNAIDLSSDPCICPACGKTIIRGIERHFEICGIDENVLAELPQTIRDEIEGHRNKNDKRITKRNKITKYFVSNVDSGLKPESEKKSKK